MASELATFSVELNGFARWPQEARRQSHSKVAFTLQARCSPTVRKLMPRSRAMTLFRSPGVTSSEVPSGRISCVPRCANGSQTASSEHNLTAGASDQNGLPNCYQLGEECLT